MAKIIQVTTLDDNSPKGDGLVSLREAIDEANGTAGETKISFAGALRGGTIYLQDYLEVTGGNITIDGDINNDGFNDITISGDSNQNGILNNSDSRLLVVRAGGTITMDYVNLVDSFFNNAGNATERAAAIANLGGNLTITNGVVSGNGAFGGNTNGDAATIFNGASGTLTVVDTLFTNNSSTGGTGFEAVSGILNKGTLVADKVGFDGVASGGGGGSTVGIKNDGALSNGGNPILVGLGTGGTGVVGGAANPVRTGVSGSIEDDLTLEIDGVNETVALGFANDDLINVTGGTSTVIGGHGEDIVQVQPNVDSVDFFGGAGVDRIDLSDSQLGGATVDLRITTLQAVATGFDLLLDSVENVFGTPDGDTIIGDSGSNKIAGHGGTDTIYGYGGADSLFASEGGTGLDPVIIHGGGGSDVINFRIGTAVIDGAGTGSTKDKHRDTFSFADSGQGGDIDLRETGAQAITFETTVTLTGIENVSGSIFDDKLTGTNGNNRVAGLEGDDILVGLGGKDEFFGGAGKDSIKGGNGADKADGGSGADVISGGNGEDTLGGGTGNDKLFGGGKDDVLRGGDGVDLVSGQAGNDSLIGDAGKDELIGGAGNDKADGGNGADKITLGAGNDIGEGGAGNDKLYGNNGSDELRGGAQADNLFGGSGADELFGDNGKDKIDGGAGGDIMTGGFGADTFVLLGSSGNDVIRDFVIGTDKIDLDGSLKFNDLAISQVGSDALVEFNGNSVRLQGIDGDDLSGSDFLF